MTKRSRTARRLPGVAPLGIVVTVLLWLLLLYGEQRLGLPALRIHPLLRFVLLMVFVVDVAYLVIGGGAALWKQRRAETLVTSGPFLFVRHPLYSALIYSATGILALWRLSWLLLPAVIPLTLFWSWLVRREEQVLLEKFGEQYRVYMETTGQFLPAFKSLVQKPARKERRN